MPETDLSLLLNAALRSGEIATRFNGPETARWDKPDDAGPVTEADLAVNRYLEDHLRAARPDYGWLSEESEDDSARLTRERVFVIDPIDGTRSFADGSKTWAHSLAIVEQGRPIAAVVYLPRRDLMFTAARGCGAECNGTPIRIARNTQNPDRARVLSARPTQEPKHWTNGEVPGFERFHRPSLAYRLARVADGSYDAMLTLRPSWEWDIAAGALLIEEAGGALRDRTGRELRFNNAQARLDGVVAAAPDLLDPILGRLIYGPRAKATTPEQNDGAEG